jgi:hypothetical protein
MHASMLRARGWCLYSKQPSPVSWLTCTAQSTTVVWALKDALHFCGCLLLRAPPPTHPDPPWFIMPCGRGPQPARGLVPSAPSLYFSVSPLLPPLPYCASSFTNLSRTPSHQTPLAPKTLFSSSVWRANDQFTHCASTIRASRSPCIDQLSSRRAIATCNLPFTRLDVSPARPAAQAALG